MLLDMMTGEMLVSNGNGIMAFKALSHALVEMGLQVMQGLGHIEALKVVKAATEDVPTEATPMDTQAKTDAVAESISSTAVTQDIPNA